MRRLVEDLALLLLADPHHGHLLEHHLHAVAVPSDLEHLAVAAPTTAGQARSQARGASPARNERVRAKRVQAQGRVRAAAARSRAQRARAVRVSPSIDRPQRPHRGPTQSGVWASHPRSTRAPRPHLATDPAAGTHSYLPRPTRSSFVYAESVAMAPAPNPAASRSKRQGACGRESRRGTTQSPFWDKN